MTTVHRTPVKPQEIERVRQLVARAAALPDVRAEVEANHDENQWWPMSITDPRVRMLAAGWSTRVSYRMVGTYAKVIQTADALGFDSLVASTEGELARLVRPLGLTQTRIDYLRSLAELLHGWSKEGVDPLSPSADGDELIGDFAHRVRGASYKVAQCALLTTRGYHCGIIPVDSGMVSKLAPALGIGLPSGTAAHERMRHVLEAAVHARAADFRILAAAHGHRVTIPEGAEPTWWVHLILIYFKRLYLNGPSPQLCRRRPLCAEAVGCAHRDRAEQTESTR
jgi:endonuclease III